MRNDPRLEALFRNLNSRPAKPAGLLQKIAAVVVGVIVFGLALTVSVMFLAVVAAVGVVVWGYLWWKTREVRKVMRDAQARAQRSGGRRTTNDTIVIEGEVVREVHEEHSEDRRQG